MNRITTLLLAGMLLASCGNNNHKGNTGTQSAAVENTNADAPMPVNSYRRFSGTIAGQPVVMHLVEMDNGSFMGNYYYVKQGRSIDVYVVKDSTGTNNYTVEEQVGKGDVANAHWNATITNGAIKGKWLSADGKKTYDIDLKTELPAGSMPLEVYSDRDSLALFPGKKGTPSADISFTLLLPAEDANKEDAAFVKTTLLNVLGCDSMHETDIKSCIKRSIQEYAGSYRSDAGELYDSTSENASLNYYSASVFNVIFNEDGWLVLQNTSSSYEGGAHGNYGSSYLNLDLVNKKEWKLEDIMTVDSAALSALLETEARSLFNIPAKQKLGESLLVDKIDANGNVYVTNTGITFHYVPYEIAAYAFGESDLFIPYSKLSNLLKPEFKKRMKL
ncbi:DUF3298 and DUF4163 domain-containing protein [Taibaiella soli]|uniref:DUF3298 domain-containing protein n=1 Tax=Taibaiella soli TaxID=1649169 RepID=A0A2W2ALF6_9BACT|nr:DUF3298 and DUF4163 domain-containing protein [Taibaiella soli]PZF73150.1 hypothetical protein DN068_09775 [Taibaiella soli]